MTLLLIGGLIVLAMLAAGIWLVQRAEAEPAARPPSARPMPRRSSEAVESSPFLVP